MKEKQKTFWKSLMRFTIPVVVACVLTFFLVKLINPISVNGSSMMPTYKPGAILKGSNHFDESDITKGKVIVFRTELLDEKNLIKRVVGVPGDTLSIKDGLLYVNGQVDESLQFESIEDAGILTDKEITLLDGEYFCLGDNRNNSTDSRVIGTVKFEDILYVITGKIF